MTDRVPVFGTCVAILWLVAWSLLTAPLRRIGWLPWSPTWVLNYERNCAQVPWPF